MTSYLVRIEGKGIDFVVADRLASALGFLGLGRKLRCTGFFTTRYVESDCEGTAVEVARQLIIDELIRKKVVSSHVASGLELHVDEVAVVPAEGSGRLNRGFTFYEEEGP